MKGTKWLVGIDKTQGRKQMNINHSIKELELSETNEKCLTEAEIIVVKDLLRLNQEQLLAIKGGNKETSQSQFTAGR